MHSLQTTFATAAGEAAWEAQLRDLFEARELAKAEAILRAALIESGGEMMRLCRDASLSSVEISGWDELAEAVKNHEGDPITGATIAIGNEADLAFEKGLQHRPYLVLGLYTDDAWGWSSASAQDALAQCRSENPEWAGWDEDIEAFLEIDGLDALNTALVHHKQRHFIREEGETAPAPLRYVEFVIGCWWRALRFHQAVAVQLDKHGLAGAIPVISGLIELRPEVVAVHWPVVRQVPASKSPEAAEQNDDAEEVESASPNLTRFNLIQRGRLVADEAEGPTGTVLRRRIEVSEENDDAAVEVPGLMRRLLGRG
jgi:hypothetical protein